MTNIPTCSDYSMSIEVPQLIKAEKLSGGSPEKINGKLTKFSGGFCIVFPYSVRKKKYAVRCWHAYLDGAKERCRLIANALAKVNLPYFVGFEYIDNAILTPQGPQPIVLMDWVEAKPLKKYIKEHLNDSVTLSKLADDFFIMSKSLNENNISHGDLQHGNILIKDSGEIVLVDYDSLYAPGLDGWSDDVKGLQGYQHPARWDNEHLSPKSDYFSELIIYTAIKAISIKPQLWYDYKVEDTETLLFEKEDIDSMGNSPLFSELNSISEISELLIKIKEALLCKSIDEIPPLETSIVRVVDTLSEMWNDESKNTVSESKYDKSVVTNITNKW